MHVFLLLLDTRPEHFDYFELHMIIIISIILIFYVINHGNGSTDINAAIDMYLYVPQKCTPNTYIICVYSVLFIAAEVLDVVTSFA